MKFLPVEILSLFGLPMETLLTINPSENSIFDIAGNVASVIQTGLLNNQSNILSINDGAVVAGDTAWIDLSLLNVEEIISIQVDLDLPARITYADTIRLSSRGSEDHLVYATFMNGNLRLVSYSPSLSAFSGNSGVLLLLGF